MKKLITGMLGLFLVVGIGCAQEDEVTDDGGSDDNNSEEPAKEFTSGQTAAVVIGQDDFTSNGVGLGASAMTSPMGVTLTEDGVLHVVEFNNVRVLGFDSVPSSNGASADTVLGQTDLTSSTNGSAADELDSPSGVSSSGSKVFVADTFNHRILIYNSQATGASASVAIGQANTSSNSDPGGGVSATTIKFPYDVFASGSKLAIADTSFNRVTLYNSIPTSSGASASRVLGQTNKTSGASGVSKMDSPRGVWTNGTKILVADTNNNRVLIWNSWPTSDGAAPDVILGQDDLTQNTSGTSASALNHPEGVASDGTEVFVSDYSNHRILYWKTWPTENNQEADLVLGQSDFTTATSGTTSKKLNSPTRIFYKSSTLYVADSQNNRVLVFKKK